jgi:hypothetical protein
MLATFPFFLQIRAFQISSVTFYVRDLFLGNKGNLERVRDAKDGPLDEADYRLAKKQAVRLKGLYLNLYTTRRDYGLGARETADESRDDDDDDDDDERRDSSLLELLPDAERVPAAPAPATKSYPAPPPRCGTLDAACVSLIRGLVSRVAASGRVGASMGHVLAPLFYHAFGGGAPQRVPKSEQDVAKKRTRSDRAPVAGLLGTRSDRQFALMVGLVKPSHKRMRADAAGDLSRPLAACGILFKTSRPPGHLLGRHWKHYRCALRGGTLFYFEVNSKGNARHGEDLVVDLRRVVGDRADVGAGRCGRDEIAFALRCEDGVEKPLFLRAPGADEFDWRADFRALDAAGWDLCGIQIFNPTSM